MEIFFVTLGEARGATVADSRHAPAGSPARRVRPAVITRSVLRLRRGRSARSSRDFRFYYLMIIAHDPWPRTETPGVGGWLFRGVDALRVLRVRAKCGSSREPRDKVARQFIGFLVHAAHRRSFLIISDCTACERIFASCRILINRTLLTHTSMYMLGTHLIFNAYIKL